MRMLRKPEAAVCHPVLRTGGVSGIATLPDTAFGSLPQILLLRRSGALEERGNESDIIL
jgi:hypothetical protein